MSYQEIYLNLFFISLSVAITCTGSVLPVAFWTCGLSSIMKTLCFCKATFRRQLTPRVVHIASRPVGYCVMQITQRTTSLVPCLRRLTNKAAPGWVIDLWLNMTRTQFVDAKNEVDMF
jgi:hypothetical protein